MPPMRISGAADRTGPSGKRLTLDIPADLHRALKVRAAELDVPMVEVVRALIQRALEDPTALRDLIDAPQ
jgi:hypothetical protein